MPKRDPIFVHKVEIVFDQPVLDSPHLFPIVCETLQVEGVMGAIHTQNVLAYIFIADVGPAAVGESLRGLDEHPGISFVSVTATDPAPNRTCWTSSSEDRISMAINEAWARIREGRRARNVIDAKMSALGVKRYARGKVLAEHKRRLLTLPQSYKPKR